MADLYQRRVLVLGGSGAMGGAIAKRAAGLGATVILAGRDRDALEAEAGKLAGAEVVVGDAVDPEGAATLFAASGHLDHIVVAISAGSRASSITVTAPVDARAAYAKVWAAYNALHHAPMLLTSGGSVLLISGSSARRPGAGFGVWTGVHGAIESLARAAVLELAPIRVNVVSPGGIGLKPDRQLLPRLGTPDDIAQAALSLITNPAITGAVLDVDSGERLGTWPEPVST
jgi:NAD(P)-dependent dehydrogenase (short-subunit alcohol dehydrogenase family)